MQLPLDLASSLLAQAGGPAAGTSPADKDDAEVMGELAEQFSNLLNQAMTQPSAEVPPQTELPITSTAVDTLTEEEEAA